MVTAFNMIQPQLPAMKINTNSALLPSSLSLLFLCSTLSVSFADDYLTEEDLFSDLPVVTGASHFPQQIANAPTSVTIIDRDMIEASGALEVVDLFRLVPGFQAFYGSEGYGTINYHALPHQFANRLEVKVDGRSVYESLFNIVIWQTLGIELDDIDHIEVIRGPNAASDGANAFSGSVNIVTKSPVGAEKAAVRTLIGDRGRRHMSAVLNESISDISFRLTTQRLFSDGFPDYEGEKVRDESDTSHLGLRGIWTPSLFDTVDINFGFSKTDLGMTEGSGSSPSSLLRWQFDYNYQHITWTRNLNNNDSFQLSYYHNDLTMNAIREIGLFSVWLADVSDGALTPEALGLEDFQVNFQIDDGKSERHEFEFRYNGSVNDLLRYSVGFANRFDSATNELFFTTSDEIDEEFHRIYVNTELQLHKQLIFNNGYQLEHSTTIGKTNSLRSGLNYHFTSAQTLRFAYNQSVFVPTLLPFNDYRTLNNDGIIIIEDRIASEDMKETELEGVELGYFGNFQDGKLSIDAKLFTEHYDDIVDDTKKSPHIHPIGLPGNLTIRDNAIWIDIDGFETQLRYQPNSDWLVGLQATFLRVKGKHRRDVEGTRFSDLSDTNSKRSGDLLVRYTLPNRWQIGGHYYYQTKVDYDGAADILHSQDRLDFRMGRDFQLGKDTLKLDIIAQNLFGNTYTEFREFNQFEPAYFLKVRFEFGH